jgi:hypothetical protein
MNGVTFGTAIIASDKEGKTRIPDCHRSRPIHCSKTSATTRDTPNSLGKCTCRHSAVGCSPASKSAFGGLVLAQGNRG